MQSSVVTTSYLKSLQGLPPRQAMDRLTADVDAGTIDATELAGAVTALTRGWSQADAFELKRLVPQLILEAGPSHAAHKATGVSTGGSLFALRVGSHDKAGSLAKSDSVDATAPPPTVGSHVVEVGKKYPVEVMLGGKPHRFDVVVTQELGALLTEKSAQIDFDNAALVTAEGRYPLLGNQDNPPWFLPHKDGEAGVPVGTLTLGLADGAVTLGFGRIRTAHTVIEAGVPHIGKTIYKGHEYDVTVRYTPAAVEAMGKHGLWIDWATNSLCGGGERVKLPHAAKYERTTGKGAPPYLMSNERGCFGIPTDIKVDLKVVDGDATWNPHFDGLNFPDHFGFGPDHDAPVTREQQDSTPISKSSWKPTTLRVSAGLHVEAATPELANKALALVHEVLGKIAPAYEKARAQVDPLRRETKDVRTQLTANKQPDAALLARARKLANVSERDAPTREDVLASLRAREGALYVPHRTIDVVVVPKGKHFSSMPHFNAETQASLEKNGAVAACYRVDERTLCLIPEEDLSDGYGKSPWISKHELHHVLQEMLDVVRPDLQDEVVRIFDQTRATDGVLARDYSAIFIEFWTTFAELFEGRAGADGARWFKDNQPRLYELMCESTGRDPLA